MIPFSIEFDTPPKIRRVVLYVTKANWDDSMPLARSSFDLHTPLYRRVYLCAPYQSCDDTIPGGLVATQTLEFNLNLPTRTVGHHVLLLEIDLPDVTDPIYQIIDLNYVS